MAKPSRSSELNGNSERAVTPAPGQNTRHQLPAGGDDVPVVRVSDQFLAAGSEALQRTRELLSVPIDWTKLNDPEWVEENYRAALVQTKLGAIQMNVALGIVSAQVRVNETRLRAASMGGGMREFGARGVNSEDE